jgi:uncharacterized protein YjbI with pentapeptide repeats
MIFIIKHRWNSTVLFSFKCESLRLCVEAAISTRADLRGADLRGADLFGADLVLNGSIFAPFLVLI